LIFIDSNIPMYLVGAMHPHKADAQQLLARCVSRRERLVTDAEVLQEILHRTWRALVATRFSRASTRFTWP